MQYSATKTPALHDHLQCTRAHFEQQTATQFLAGVDLDAGTAFFGEGYIRIIDQCILIRSTGGANLSIVASPEEALVVLDRRWLEHMACMLALMLSHSIEVRGPNRADRTQVVVRAVVGIWAAVMIEELISHPPNGVGVAVAVEETFREELHLYRSLQKMMLQNRAYDTRTLQLGRVFYPIIAAWHEVTHVLLRAEVETRVELSGKLDAILAENRREIQHLEFQLLSDPGDERLLAELDVRAAMVYACRSRHSTDEILCDISAADQWFWAMSSFAEQAVEKGPAAADGWIANLFAIYVESNNSLAGARLSARRLIGTPNLPERLYLKAEFSGRLNFVRQHILMLIRDKRISPLVLPHSHTYDMKQFVEFTNGVLQHVQALFALCFVTQHQTKGWDMLGGLGQMKQQQLGDTRDAISSLLKATGYAT